jgi:uncharacterized protein YcsI (UPF0317 family)
VSVKAGDTGSGLRYVQIVQNDARVARSAIRAGAFAGTTAGLARGFVQGNIAIVPSDVADQFARYCANNSRACPVLSIGEAGDPSLPSLGEDIDIRTDVPRYYIYRHGVLAEERREIASLWRRDFVTFVIGCSFTFEHALRDAGVPLRHVESNRNVAMYRTNRSTHSVGPFGGALVVSMRPFSSEDADRAVAISARFPTMHGAPIHRGDPAVLGIADLSRPDYGEAVPVQEDDVPLFWACGVTSQVALQSAELPLFISHAPGCMLVTDMTHDRVAS